VYSRGRRLVQLVVNDKVEEQADFQEAALLNMKPAWLGGWQGGLRWFAGDIDELRVWNAVRSPRQIRAAAGMELEGKEENLLAYYKFNELKGKTAMDSSPNGNVGYLCGRMDPDKLSPDECAALCPSRVVQTEPIGASVLQLMSIDLVPFTTDHRFLVLPSPPTPFPDRSLPRVSE
jgi:hypothetical protein